MILERYDYAQFDPARVQYAYKCLEDDGFGPHGEKIDFSHLMEQDPLNVSTVLFNRTQHIIQGLEILNKDGGKYEIFNRHDGPHIFSVYRKGLYFAR